MELFASLETIKIGNISLADVLSTLFVLIICLIAKRIIKKAAANIIEKTRLDKGIKTFLTSAIDILIWIILILIVADNLGIPVNSLVALVSVASLALSLSVQNLLTNIFSGMSILGTKPFTVGDFIDIDGTSGTVTSLGLFYTVINTTDNRVIYTPNSTVAGAKVINYSVNPMRRIELTVTASYDDEPERVKAALLKAVELTEGTLSDPAPFTGVLSYGSSSIEYQLYAWADRAEFLKVKFNLTENIYSVFKSEGVTMTYDHLNIHVVDK